MFIYMKKVEGISRSTGGILVTKTVNQMHFSPLHLHEHFHEYCPFAQKIFSRFYTSSKPCIGDDYPH